MKKEEWKKVKHEAGYLISSWGRVFSLKREILLKPYHHKSRAGTYLRVSLNGNRYMIHCLVGMNFKRKQYLDLSKKNKKIQANHDDRNTLNCNANNVTWMTEEDNKKHLAETNFVKFNNKIYKLKMEK